jgi:hypothetical protein
MVDNRYARIYRALIARAQERTLACYSEKHHILPKSLGGSNTQANIVRLTPREHYIAHLCLVRCYMGREKQKMLNAIRYLVTNTTHGTRKYNSKLFAQLREQYALSLKGNRRGIGNRGSDGRSFRGRVHTLASKEKMRQAKLGQPHSKAHTENIRRAILTKYASGWMQVQPTPTLNTTVTGI